jgi:hypothetical protein
MNHGTGRLPAPGRPAPVQERFPNMQILDDLPQDVAQGEAMTQRIVELRRMMAPFEYGDLLLTIRVAESLMREQRMVAAIAQRSGVSS